MIMVKSKLKVKRVNISVYYKNYFCLLDCETKCFSDTYEPDHCNFYDTDEAEDM